MSARRPGTRPVYDGVAFRRLREHHHIALVTVLGIAAQRRNGVQACSYIHADQWEAGKRNIRSGIAHDLAAALSAATGQTVNPADFEIRQAAA